MFVGSPRARLDDKGRVVLPAKYREQLADGVVITKGQEGCLYVFPSATFQQIAELAEKADDTFISAYPNAGLPNPLTPTGFDLTPAEAGHPNWTKTFAGAKAQAKRDLAKKAPPKQAP